MKEKAKSSELFSSVSFVALETNQDVLLGDEIMKIERLGDHIYVADRSAVYKFDAGGKLLKKMSKRGPGPEEHRAISDVAVIDEDSFWILCSGNRTLYKFNWEGDLLDRFRVNGWASKMYLLSPERMCLYIGRSMIEGNRHQLRMINPSTHEETGRYVEVDPNEARYINILPSAADRFSPSANGIYFFGIFTDSIYELRDGAFSPAYYVNIRNKNIPKSFFEEEHGDIQLFFEAIFKRGFAYGTDLFVDSGDKFLFSYMHDRTAHYAFIDKKTGESVVDCTTLTEDVALRGYPLKLADNDPFVQKNNDLIFPIQPFDLMQYAEENMNEEDIRRFRQTLHITEDDQNPILLILKI
jgi:hypothetical protein